MYPIQKHTNKYIGKEKSLKRLPEHYLKKQDKDYLLSFIIFKHLDRRRATPTGHSSRSTPNC
jgi:hypothetical protein